MAVVTVGVLALQGGFLEHLTLLHRSAQHLSTRDPAVGGGAKSTTTTFDFIEVRTPQDLARCDGLIIPGGESTTIALIAAQSGLLEPLRAFVKSARKPTWGTCAGLILLAEQANATKKGGQDLIGGLDVRVHRNHFGRQTESFEAAIPLPFLAQSEVLSGPDAAAPFPGVFIRAPIVEQLLWLAEPKPESEPEEEKEEKEEGKKATRTKTIATGPPTVVVEPGVVVVGGKAQGNRTKNDDQVAVEILGVLPDRTKKVKGGPLETFAAEVQGGELNDIVAVRQGNVMGTSFHPELTSDVRIHVWWLEQVLKTVDLAGS